MPPLNHYPSVDHLHVAAKKRLPKFSYDYVDSGTGPGVGRALNRSAVEAVKLTPRYVTDWGPVRMETELFGRKYKRPFGIPPMGLASLQWPKAELHFAAAGKKADIPVTLSTACCVDIEEFAAVAGDNAWFQLYPPKDEAVNDDLIKRASDSGYKALMVTVDVPTRAWRPRDMYNGLAVPPRITAATIWNAAMRPHWSLATLAAGIPHFKTLGRYSPDKSMRGMADFVSEQLAQQVTTERLKRIRDQWKGDLIIKGVMHPADAEAAIDLGYNGILVSNHGGRQLDAAPASIEVLPEIVDRVGDRATVMVDSGFSNGLDIMKGLALGAKFVFCGRAFMWGLGALGARGPSHVADLLTDELEMSLIQLGCPDIKKLDRSWLSQQ
jgi:isopentenyl diphosphate isomerase/L-lactate dehydrogenase-like FMN-dependent dehydrogenase